MAHVPLPQSPMRSLHPVACKLLLTVPTHRGMARQADTQFTYPGRMNGWVDLGCLQDGLPACRQSPIQVETRQPIAEQLCWTRPTPGCELIRAILSQDNCTVEVFSSRNGLGCYLRSSKITLFNMSYNSCLLVFYSHCVCIHHFQYQI